MNLKGKDLTPILLVTPILLETGSTKRQPVSLTQPNNPVVLTVPLHRELKPGLLRGLIPQLRHER